MRIAVSLLLAALINLALFALMSAMVSQRISQSVDSTLVQIVEFVRPQPPEEPRPKQRQMPPQPPEPLVAIQPLPEVELPPPDAEPPPLQEPEVNLEPPLQLDGRPYLGTMRAKPRRVKRAKAAAKKRAKTTTAKRTKAPAKKPAKAPALMRARDLTPLATPAPSYPRKARRRGKEGYVEVEFTVSKQGGVQNIRVIAAKPRGVFERAAKRAIARWKFRPHRVGGKAVAVRARQRVQFKLKSK